MLLYVCENVFYEIKIYIKSLEIHVIIIDIHFITGFQIQFTEEGEGKLFC